MKIEDLDAYMVAVARLLELNLSDDSRRAVLANLAVLESLAGEFSALELDDETDPAGLLRL